jgi:hypothetical protein
MRRLPSLIAMPLAAAALISASLLIEPAQQAEAQTPKPTTAPAPAKPAGAATAPRAGGIPLEMAAGMVAGGSGVAAFGLYALRRRKR